MANMMDFYANFYYNQLLTNYQMQMTRNGQSSPTPQNTEIKEEIEEKPQKKLTNFSMANILGTSETEKTTEPKPEPVAVPKPFYPAFTGYTPPVPFPYSAVIGEQRKSPKEQKQKRSRTIFTPTQIDRLEIEFQTSQYMIGGDRIALAKELDLTETQVKVWFQNRRIKSRKLKKSQIDSAGEDRSESSENESIWFL